MKIKKIIFTIIEILIIVLVFKFLFLDLFFNNKLVTVPDVINMKQADAEKLLKDSYLNIKIISGSSSKHPIGSVISQYPSPNSQVKIRRNVQITINNGSYTSLPDITYMHISKAKEILKSLNITIENIDYYSFEGSEDIVLSTFPEANTAIALNQGVSLLVSKKPDLSQKIMPNLIGLTLDEANLILANSQTKISDISYVEDLKQKTNTILVTNPVAGQPIQNGYISVVLNKLNEEALEQNIDDIIRDNLPNINTGGSSE